MFNLYVSVEILMIINLLLFLLFLFLFIFYYSNLQSLKASDFDEFDGVYADLDDTNVNYGPINYKQASVYQFMKFKSPQR